MDAVREGHSKVAIRLSQAGGTLNYDEAGASSMMCDLARKGDAEGVRLLIECKCSVTAVDYDQRSCMHLAASTGNTLIVAALLDAHADVAAMDRWEGTPLADAIREHQNGTADLLINKGARVSYDETRAASELCEMAKKGDIERMKLLLRGGCAVNAADYDKRTCLHLASSEGNKHLVDELLKFGAEPNVKDRWGGTPLADAVREGHQTVADVLLAAGAQFLFDETRAASELCEYAKAGDLERVRMLLHGGCPPSLADYDLRTCMHLAATEGNAPVIKELVERGVDVNVADRWGNTPLADAVRHGHKAAVTLLRAAGAEMGLPPKRAASELCELACEGNLQAILMRLDCGTDPQISNFDGRNVLHVAAAEGHRHIVDELLKRGGVDAAAKDRWGHTAKDDAAMGSYTAVLDLLSK